MSSTTEFVYRIPGKPGTSRPGAHRSNSRGPGLAFSSYARLLDQPDPRRLDLRASLRDVKREWLVRATRQHSATVVQAIVDVSRSMNFGIQLSKLSVVADFIESLGQSAYRYGDALGMTAFDHELRDDLGMPARNGRGVGLIMAENLRSLSQDKQAKRTVSEDTLIECAVSVSQSTSLLFLVSDFHWPLDALDKMLDELSHITVVPIVVWDNSESSPPEKNGWVRSRDVESGSQQSMWLRDSTRKRWIDNVKQRRADIHQIFGAYNIAPYFMENGFDAENLSRHFIETAL